MAAKHDQSSTAQQSSTVNQTSTSTQSIADSYNQTNSYAYNLDNFGNVNVGAPGQSSGLDLTQIAIIGGGAVLMLMMAFFLRR
jgi:hypothetical protein